LTSPSVKASAPSRLLDAGPLVELLDADDQWHGWSRKGLTAIPGALRTTETAAAEACYLLRDHRPALSAILRMIDSGALVIEPLNQRHAARIAQLLADYTLMDFGDATLVVLSELYPKAKLVTLDVRDYTIYRRIEGSAVPIIAPGRD
jgi:predicted nucleic acid-binding protein